MQLDYSKFKIKITADFETSTEAWKVDKARVWLWDMCDMSTFHHKTGTKIEDFIDAIKLLGKLGNDSVIIGFHNLAYDGMYLLNYLLENGFTAIAEENIEVNQIYTLINTMGQHYAYYINFGILCKHHKPFKVLIVDTYKTIHLSVRKIAEAYKLPILKGEIDYDLYRDIDWLPTEEEKSYIKNDTEIVARALVKNFQMKLTKVTQPANAFSFYKKLIGKEEFESLFPVDDNFDLARKAYYGGMCWADPDKINQVFYQANSYDINSMYPSAMLHSLLPYGYGEFGKGNCLDFINEFNKKYGSFQYKLNENCVYVQKILVNYELKPNGVPSLFKNRVSYSNELHSTTSNFCDVELVLTHTDLELLFENYYVYEIKYIEFALYKAKKGYNPTIEEFKTLPYEKFIEIDGKGSMFYEYIKFWRVIKENSKGAERENAKFMQNMLYGNFGKNIDGYVRIPYINEEDKKIHFKVVNGGNKRIEYVPVACFITAWCRYNIIKDIIKNRDIFLYCDTDSLYLLTNNTPDLLIHKTIYGAYKNEHIIDKIKVIGSKRYIYWGREPDENYNSFNVKCCGADNDIKKQINFSNFNVGLILEGKKQVKTVVGGKHISLTSYKIK